MDWPTSRRVERRARRMHEMMKRLNVDTGALARLRRSDAYAEACGRHASPLSSGALSCERGTNKEWCHDARDPRQLVA